MAAIAFAIASGLALMAAAMGMESMVAPGVIAFLASIDTIVNP